jgi:hypothetical protein
MALSPFEQDPGVEWGRIQPSGWVPPDESWVLALGHDTPGCTGAFNVGDRVEVSQGVDFAGVKLLRLRARLRPPENVPAGVAWRASMLIDGVEMVGETLTPGRSRDVNDWALNVSKLAGTHILTFRLALVTA